MLTTGTDEHGVNVERAAEAQGKTAAGIYRRHLRRVSRAVEDSRARGSTVSSGPPAIATRASVQDLFLRCQERGHVYKGHYTGQYCIFDNLYVNDAKPGDPCPECGRPTETVTEENYFFRLSAFQRRLLDLYESQPDFIQPETRRNEVIAFVQTGPDRICPSAARRSSGGFRFPTNPSTSSMSGSTR